MLAVLVALPWVVCAVARGLSLDRSWVVVSALSFTPWFALTGWVAVMAAALLRVRTAVVVSLVAWVVLIVAVHGRALPDAQPRADGPRVTVTTSNVYFGRADPAAVVALVRSKRVDVLALVEVTPELRRALRRAGLDRLLPYAIDESAPRASGASLLSRRPLRRLRAARRPARRESFAPFAATAGLELQVAHPSPPINAPDHAAWERILREQPAAAPARVVLGDLNATLDHRELRRVLGRGWRDAADEVGAGWRPTWPVRGSRALPLTIDHVLVGPGIRVEDVSVHEVRGSDHRAVVARLRLP